MKGEMIAKGHLGGYVEGGDEATQYPHLWAWLSLAGVETVLDVGCGDGTAMKTMGEIGLKVWGVDGVPQSLAHFSQHDYAAGPFFWDSVDAVWCCEFVEHIEERYMKNFLETFKSARKMILMTHASVGQAGHHHVNCRDPGYWTGAMAGIGYGLHPTLTENCRRLAAHNTNPYNHFVRSGLVFTPYENNKLAV